MPRTEIYDFEIVIYFYTHIDILCLNIFFQLGEYQTAELNVVHRGICIRDMSQRFVENHVYVILNGFIHTYCVPNSLS